MPKIPKGNDLKLKMGTAILQLTRSVHCTSQFRLVEIKESTQVKYIFSGFAPEKPSTICVIAREPPATAAISAVADHCVIPITTRVYR